MPPPTRCARRRADRRLVRSAFVIARRDFTATVLSKTFIFFLLAPLFPAAIEQLFGGIGARVASQTERAVIAIVAPPEEFARIDAARDELATGLGNQALVKIVRLFSERSDLADQQKQLLASGNPPVRAVMSGGLDHPKLVGGYGDDPATVTQLKLLHYYRSKRGQWAGRCGDECPCPVWDH